MEPQIAQICTDEEVRGGGAELMAKKATARRGRGCGLAGPRVVEITLLETRGEVVVMVEPGDLTHLKGSKVGNVALEVMEAIRRGRIVARGG